MAEPSAWAHGVHQLILAVHHSGAWGVGIYILAVAASVVFLLPGAVLTLAAGFLFGAIPGTLVFLSGESLGASLAFWLAGRVLRGRVMEYCRHHPKLGILNASVSESGWKFVALTRLTPFFPFKLSNYFFGASGYRFRDFFWGTVIGTMPITFTMVYLGSLVPDPEALHGHVPLENPIGRFALIGIAIAAVTGMLLMSRHASRVYRRKMAAWERRHSAPAQPAEPR